MQAIIIINKENANQRLALVVYMKQSRGPGKAIQTKNKETQRTFI